MPTETDQQQFAEQLAQQLKGLALPEAVSWWPLAIGWWFVIVFLLLVVSLVSYKLITNIKQNKYRKTATSELQTAFRNWQKHNHTLDYLHASNSILKRVIKKIERNSNTVNLSKSGDNWGEVLQHYAKRPLSELTLSALTSDCYQANPTVDVPSVHEQISTWIKNHQRQPNA